MMPQSWAQRPRSMGGITIIGSGRHLPGEPVDNAALARVMDTSDEWIRKRTGIERRHFAAEGEGVSDLALPAAKKALEAAKLQPQDIDFIIFATMTPDYVFPGAGGLLGAKLGIPGVPALDIRQQCCAMPFSFQVAHGLVESGAARTILIIGGDAHAGFMPWTDWDVLYGESDAEVAHKDFDRGTRHRGLAVLFGDGAGALVVRRAEDENRGYIGTELHTDGTLAEQIYLKGGGFNQRPFVNERVIENEEYIPSMGGRELFKTAVTRLPAVVRSLCERENVELDEIDWFIAHQANDRINQAVVQSLGLDPAKVPSNIANYGNTSGGTIPILLDELIRDGKVKTGDLLCFLALGSGLHWGSTLLRL